MAGLPSVVVVVTVVVVVIVVVLISVLLFLLSLLLLPTQFSWQVCPLCQAEKEGRHVMVMHLIWHPEVRDLLDKDAPDDHFDYHCPEGCLPGLGLGRDQFVLHKYRTEMQKAASMTSMLVLFLAVPKTALYYR